MITKYRAKKVTTADGVFDSKREYHRWLELKEQEAVGLIKDLDRQVGFLLIDDQREPSTRGPRGGVKKGRLLEKKCTYKADFVYRNFDGEIVVEDAKGFRTKEYVIKRKLMLQKYGIRIKEV